MLLNSSPLRWIEVPLPLEAMFSLPGLARSQAMSWATVSIFNAAALAGFITSTLGTPATRVMGAKSAHRVVGHLGVERRR